MAMQHRWVHFSIQYLFQGGDDLTQPFLRKEGLRHLLERMLQVFWSNAVGREYGDWKIATYYQFYEIRGPI